MLIKIPLGKTYVNIEALQNQIDALRQQGYDERDNVPVDSHFHIYIGKDRNHHGETFKKFSNTMAWNVPEIRMLNENTLRVKS